mgnify:CR=1 FL=1
MKRIDADTYTKTWVCVADPGTVEHVVSGLRGITNRRRSHDFVGNPNVLAWLLGREPTTVDPSVSTQARLREIS